MYFRKYQTIVTCLSDVNKCMRESFNLIFTALHVMQTRYSEENSVRLSVCLSVRPSVTRVIPDKTEERSVQIFIPDKTEERSVQIFIPYERIFILVF